MVGQCPRYRRLCLIVGIAILYGGVVPGGGGGLSVKTVQEREENLDDQKETATLEAERLHLELEDYQKQLSDLEVRPSPPLKCTGRRNS